jgi:DNA-binding NarL/FixJ family response regulator
MIPRFRVLLVDDHVAVEQGLRRLFRDQPFELVAWARNGLDAIRLQKDAEADLILMEVNLPECDGMETLETILQRDAEAQILFYSTSDNLTHVARAILWGALDYRLKRDPISELLKVMKAIAEGKAYEPSEIFRRVRKQFQPAGPVLNHLTSFTNREMQVLRLVALGLSNREIARSLAISVETVKEHVQNILRKIDVTDRTAAAVWAIQHQLG